MFTPGPWKYEATTKTIRSNPANYWLASMDSWDGAVDNEANATLIAAAPELLAALEAARKELQEVTVELQGEDYNNPAMNAIIAKAKSGKE